MRLNRFSLLSWLLAGVLLLSLGLNLYFLTSSLRSSAGEWTLVWDDEAWDDDQDDDDAFVQSRTALADELRRTRQQLLQCQSGATPLTPSSVPAGG